MPKTIDQYGFLNIKRPTTQLDRILVSLDWVPKEHQRRLQAYMILAAYATNQSNLVRREPHDDLHEYGDPNFVCSAMTAAVLGDSVRIVAPDRPDIEDWFARWAEDTFFFAKVAANEYKASSLGDMVYRVHWSKLFNMPMVETFDAGFYFPMNIGEYNEERNLAWETTEADGIGSEIYRERYARDNSQGGKGQIILQSGYYKKGTGTFDDLAKTRNARNQDGEDISDVKIDLSDFPIVHIPNILREGENFGEADLAQVFRVIDDLTNTYSDESANAYLMGLAMLWIDPKVATSLPIGADGRVTLEAKKNQVFAGEAGVIDNSMINKALIDLQHELESKLMQNTFLTDIGAGRLKSSSADRTTGIHQLKGSLLERYVEMKRMIRTPMYNKLLRLIGELAMKNSKDSKTRKMFSKGNGIRAARIQFGNVLPVNQSARIEDLSRIGHRLSDQDLKDNLLDAGVTIRESIVPQQKGSNAQ